MPGSTTKTCPSCGAIIAVASKTCKACGERQPYKALKQRRLERAKQRIERSPNGHKANAVKFRDTAYVQLHNLRAAGYVPVLLLGRKKGLKMTVEILSLSENPSPEERKTYEGIRAAFENLLNGGCSGGTDRTPPVTGTSTVGPPVSTQPSPLQPSTTSFSCTAISTPTAPSHTSPTSTNRAKSTNQAESTNQAPPSTPCTPAERGGEAAPEMRTLKPVEMDGPEVLYRPCEVPAEMDKFIHQVPVRPLDLESNFPIISEDVSLENTASEDHADDIMDFFSELEDPSSKTGESTDVLQHMLESYSPTLDLNAIEAAMNWDTLNMTELIPSDGSGSHNTEVPSVDAQEDNFK